jgi:hypothetical protein
MWEFMLISQGLMMKNKAQLPYCAFLLFHFEGILTRKAIICSAEGK